MMAVYCTPASGDPHGLKKIAWRIRAHGYESLGGVWGGMGKEVIIEDPVSIKYMKNILLSKRSGVGESREIKSVWVQQKYRPCHNNVEYQ
ncbi:hypothetical protein ACOSQ2_023834 [Xanthoceras sorbifolium]